MPRQFISQIKVPDNEQAYDIKAYQSAGIYYAAVDSTSTSTAYTVTIPELTVTEYYDGLTILLYNGKVTSASGFTINVNGLGALPSYSNMALGNPVTPTDPTRDTTIFNINYAMLFTYNSTRVSGGCWICYRGYDANTNTIGYQVRTNNTTLKASAKFYRYRLLFTSADGTKWVPANTSTSTNATAKRDAIQTPIDPFGEIVWYGTTTAIEANANVTAAQVWQQYYGSYTAIGYSFNTTGAAATMTANLPIYIKCTPQANGSAIIYASQPYVQTLPSTEDGYIYILLGRAYNATNFELLLNHPIYYYKEGSIRVWTNAESGLPSVSASDNGKLLTVVNGGWAPATKPSYTANEVGALPSNTTYVSSVNGQSGAVTVATPGTLNTTATTAQSTSASEALSDTVTLHKISKTGTYSDLIGTPTLATVATSGSYTDLSNTPTLGTAAALDITNVYSATGTNPITGTGVAAALATLPTPMQFKGSLGTGGTITSLPAASGSNTGYTYKVITAGTYASQAAKIGDIFISNGTEWVYVPSGDEPSGTVTSVAISNGGGLSVSGSPITSSGTITISHSDTSSQASVSNSGRTYIQSVTLDTYGHVTGLSSATETVTDTNTTYTLNVSGTGDNATKVGLVAGGSGSGTNWYTIPYATTAGSANSVAWANISGHDAGVDADLGINTSSGDTTKFLNAKGGWTVPAGTYVHPAYNAADAAAIKVGRDAQGHVVIGNALTYSDVGAAASSHSHGNVLSGGTMTSSVVTSVTSDYLVFSDASNSGKIERQGFTAITSTLINSLGEGTSPAQRDDYIVAQYAGGGTSTITYHRRKLSNIFAALTAADIPSLTSAKISDFTTSARGAISGTSPISYNSTTGVITHAAALSSAVSSGFYKIATDVYGHVIGTAAVAKSDITALGIPASDTNTTYTLNVSGTGDNATKVGLVAGGSGSGTTWYTIPYATQVSIIKGYQNSTNAGITTSPGNGNIRYDFNMYTGVTGLFPTSSNANGTLTFSTHNSGNYYHQLGLSSDGNLYHRAFEGESLNITKGWNKILSTGNITSIYWANVALATSSSNDKSPTFADSTAINYKMRESSSTTVRAQMNYDIGEEAVKFVFV